jgi:hypothetical protein
VLQASDALNGDVETPRESHVPVRMTTRHVKSTEEALGDLPGYRVVVGYKGNPGFDAARNSFRRVRRKNNKGKEVITFRYVSR